jgi:hypothetical protein
LILLWGVVGVQFFPRALLVLALVLVLVLVQ